MSSSPCRPSPPIEAVIASALVAVAAMTRAPPRFCSSRPRRLPRIDAVMRAELAGKVAFLGAARDGDRAKTHLHRELHPEMTKPADPEDGDQIARSGAGAAQRIEHGQPGARERRGVNSRQCIRDARECSRRRHDVFGVSAGKRCSGDHPDLAVHEIAATAAAAMPAIAARPADRHPITMSPTLHTVAERVDPPGDLMTWSHRELHTGPLAVDENASEWQMPQASTATRTLPDPGPASA